MRLILLAGALACAAAVACSDADETIADETVADDSDSDDTETDEAEADDTDEDASDDTDEDASDDTDDGGSDDVPTDDGDEPSAGDAGAGAFPVECTLDQENPEDPEGFTITFTDETVECGAEMCQGASIEGLVGTAGCCVDEDAGTCGLDMSTLGLLLNLRNPGCEELDRPGSCDVACGPSTPIPLTALGSADAPAEGIQLPGCCQADGTCGFQANFGGFGFGCVGADRFGQESDGACDYSR